MPKRKRKLALRHTPMQPAWTRSRDNERYRENTGMSLEANLTFQASRGQSRELFPHAKNVLSAVYPYAVFKQRAKFSDAQMDHLDAMWHRVFWANFAKATPELFPWAGRYPQIEVLGGKQVLTNPGMTYNKLRVDPLGLAHKQMTLHEAFAHTVARSADRMGCDAVAMDGQAWSYAKLKTRRKLGVPWGESLRLIVSLLSYSTPVIGNTNGPSPFLPCDEFEGCVFEDADDRAREAGQRYSRDRETRLREILGPKPAPDPEGNNWTEGSLSEICDNPRYDHGAMSVYAVNPRESLLSSDSAIEQRIRFGCAMWQWHRRSIYATWDQEGPYLSIDRTLEDRVKDFDPWAALPKGEFDFWLDVEPGIRRIHRNGLHCRLLFASDGTRYRMRINMTARKIDNVDPFSAHVKRVWGRWK